MHGGEMLCRWSLEGIAVIRNWQTQQIYFQRGVTFCQWRAAPSGMADYKGIG